MTNRKIFNYDNLNENKITQLSNKKELYENSVSACGCLFYKFVNNKLKLLLIKYEDSNWPLLDDFGGQIDECDNTVFDAICRETSEETNNVLTKEYLSDWIENGDYKTFYNKISKYYLLLIESNENFYDDTSIFGTTEQTENIKRQIKWFDYVTHKKKLAHRLGKNFELIKYLDELSNNL